jgi:HCOMODA/2-hydroxy-3-carboxy-muconic semialdehyde decarboxylase
VVHHHAPAVLPFCIAGVPIAPVFHLGSAAGETVPFWNQHDEFGDTNMLVVKPEEGASLARALGSHWMVLMKRHGVTVAGISVQDCVFRSIYSARNAEFQVRAMAIGSITALSPGETKLAGQLVKSTTGLARSWEYWSMRVAKAGGLSTAAKKVKSTRAVAKPLPSRKKRRRAN